MEPKSKVELEKGGTGQVKPGQTPPQQHSGTSFEKSEAEKLQERQRIEKEKKAQLESGKK